MRFPWDFSNILKVMMKANFKSWDSLYYKINLAVSWRCLTFPSLKAFLTFYFVLNNTQDVSSAQQLDVSTEDSFAGKQKDNLRCFSSISGVHYWVSISANCTQTTPLAADVRMHVILELTHSSAEAPAVAPCVPFPICSFFFPFFLPL